jgi:hypothetical protein
MKVSRISFPINSPDHPESTGRAYLDMVDGVLTLVTVDGAAPLGPLKVISSVALDYEITPANVGSYIRKTHADANTLTITEAAYLVGSVVEFKNVGAGTCTITDDTGVTLIGTAAIATGEAAKLICVVSDVSDPEAPTSTWEILAYA